MERRTREALETIFRGERGFYERADALMRVLTIENVADVMASVPLPFRTDFKRFANEAYLPDGPLVLLSGAALPHECVAAVRAWLAGGAMARDARSIPIASAGFQWCPPVSGAEGIRFASTVTYGASGR